MAKKPSEVRVMTEQPPTKLTPEQVKQRADELEATIDAWLVEPVQHPRKPPLVVPYRIEDPDVLAELARRYEAAGWLAAPSGLALTLALPPAPSKP